MSDIKIIQGDCLKELYKLKPLSYDLVYIDPPFNTGKTQQIHNNSYADNNDDYLSFIENVLWKLLGLIKDTGSIFVHLDYREIHYVKVMMDEIFGRDNFRNEIIWSYDFGGRSKKCWSKKHDTILWYSMSDNYTFNYEAIDRIPYMSLMTCSSGKLSKEEAESKLAKGKTPTDVWWNTIVHTTGRERVGYPTQKPLKILERIVLVHSNKGDKLLDCFAGSGSFGEAAIKHNRNCILIDNNLQAIEVMEKGLRATGLGLGVSYE